MRGLIVGLGSIGKRHLANFRNLRPDDDIAVLRRHDDGEAVRIGADGCLTSLAEAIAYQPDWAVIASPATYHVVTAVPLARSGVKLFVEKPLAGTIDQARRIVDACRIHNQLLMTGYNLRFHPCLETMRVAIESRRIGRLKHIQASVGQYLPDWRPSQDYRCSVSAKRELGGGALRELSHELDYVQMLAGPMNVQDALIENRGDLEIDVEDWVDLSLVGVSSEHSGPVTAHVHLDFLSRQAHRFCHVVGSHGELHWDAISQRLVLTKNEKKEILVDQTRSDRNQTYLEIAREFLLRVENQDGFHPGDESGLMAMHIIEQAERNCNDSSDKVLVA